MAMFGDIGIEARDGLEGVGAYEEEMLAVL